MREKQELDLVFGVLDHQLVDVDGRRCGKVDDMELEGGAGEPLVVTALLSGAGYWSGRFHGPFRRLFRRLGGAYTRVEWPDVGEIAATVELRRGAHDLRLGRGDERAARYVDWIPGS